MRGLKSLQTEDTLKSIKKTKRTRAHTGSRHAMTKQQSTQTEPFTISMGTAGLEGGAAVGGGGGRGTARRSGWAGVKGGQGGRRCGLAQGRVSDASADCGVFV